MKDPYDFKEQLKEYFYFSKSEQRGIIILFFLIGFFLLLPKMYKAWFYKEKIVDFSEYEAEIKAFEQGKQQYRDSIQALKNKSATFSKSYKFPEKFTEKKEAQLFRFDPNIASFDELVSLGLKKKTAQTLINFRAKGGTFREPDDLKKSMVYLRMIFFDFAHMLISVIKREMTLNQRSGRS